MDSSMNFQHIDTPNGYLIIKLSGEMDALGCSKIHPDLEAITNTEHLHIILDINQVNFIDSSGIGAIIFLFKRLKAQQRTLEIIGVQGQPEELLKLLRIESAIPITTKIKESDYQGGIKCVN
ncbi:MAG: anti-anti-sigma factor [Moritella sp.]|jgi:anti-anti-sigma factor